MKQGLRRSFSRAQMASFLQSCITHRSLLPGRTTHAALLRHGLSHDIFLANRLLELYSLCALPRHASNLFDAMPHRNIYSWNALLSTHCRAGDLQAALCTLAQMPERNVVSFNTVITVASRGDASTALRLYDAMLREGILPTRFTLASVLGACGNAGAAARGRRCHGLALKLGLDANSFVSNALVAMYAKCWCMEEAHSAFEAMPSPNHVSFTAMLSGLAQRGASAEALALFCRMHAAGIPVDQVAVSAVLNACACAGSDGVLSFAQSVHALLLNSGFQSDTHVGNSLVDMYMKCRQLQQAELAFRTLPAITVVSWNVLISGCCLNGDSARAMALLGQMQSLGFEPDDATYVPLIATCVRSGDFKTASRMVVEKNSIFHPGVIMWNTLVSGYCQEDEYEKALDMFRRMQVISGIRPDRTTLAAALSSCSGIGLLSLGKQVHAASVRLMLHVDVFVGSALVDMYSKCGCTQSARLVFKRMPERDVVSWNSLISGLAGESLTKEAFVLFGEMRAVGIVPTEYSYAGVISSCARLSCLVEGKEIHTQAEKDGLASNVFVGSTLVDFYAKCGSIDEARRFFDGMKIRNVVSWNEMIHGYAQNGEGNAAVELYYNMLEEAERPDHVTFIAALTACSHSGLVDRGLEIFRSMEPVHGVKPMADHYTCIVDALGRAGRFEEIEDLIGEMPFKDCPKIWEVLLSACRVHGNVRLGRLATEHLFRYDPCNSSAYVLLSNIYAESGRWQDASAVRRLMNERGVAKDRGYSWIDHKGVHAFMVDGTVDDHSQSITG